MPPHCLFKMSPNSCAASFYNMNKRYFISCDTAPNKWWIHWGSINAQAAGLSCPGPPPGCGNLGFCFCATIYNLFTGPHFVCDWWQQDAAHATKPARPLIHTIWARQRVCVCACCHCSDIACSGWRCPTQRFLVTVQERKQRASLCFLIIIGRHPRAILHGCG